MSDHATKKMLEELFGFGPSSRNYTAADIEAAYRRGLQRGFNTGVKAAAKKAGNSGHVGLAATILRMELVAKK